MIHTVHNVLEVTVTQLDVFKAHQETSTKVPDTFVVVDTYLLSRTLHQLAHLLFGAHMV